MTTEYVAYLVHVEDRYNEIHIGKFNKLSKALINVRVACREKGIANWDWVVDKYIDCEDVNSIKLIQRRSSVGGFEPL